MVAYNQVQRIREKIVQIKKKLSPQPKHEWNIQWETAVQLPPTIADFRA